MSTGGASVTIGVLDGVHFGHRELISRLKPDLTTTVLTFDPHPVEVLRPGTHPRLITSIEERVELLEGAGVDHVGVLDLGEIKELSPEEFVGQVLVQDYSVAHLVVGVNFRFGKNRSGDARLLKALGEQYGFFVETAGLVASGPAPISSSRIRREVESGRLHAVSDMMPVRFRLTNTVIEGDKRGSALGYPTANLAPPERKVLPANGVYAAFTHTPDGVHHSAVNVGVRPTFGAGGLVVESFLIDFNNDLYGKEVTIEFVEYLRPEVEFGSAEELVLQMRKDVEQSVDVLSATGTTVS